jgi:tRNA/rRNA methyltransferase
VYNTFPEATGTVNCVESPTIILVEPSLAVNVGAAARAMKNMGFSRLRLVYADNKAKHLSDPARRMSAGSEEILEQAQVFPSLDEALADIQVVAGCTARQGKGRSPLLAPRGLREHAAGHGPETRFGVVFGREDRGLTNAELDLCHLVVTVPTAPEHPSLNLAQAVLLICYELRGGAAAGSPDMHAQGPPATSGELEELYRHARKVLLRVGFLDPQNPDRILRVLRRMLGRVGPDSREVAILRGILRQMDWYAGKVKGESR